MRALKHLDSFESSFFILVLQKKKLQGTAINLLVFILHIKNDFKNKTNRITIYFKQAK
jgi:hypothetical protein